MTVWHRGVSTAAVLASTLALAAPAGAQDDRPYIYGCGVCWGQWHGLAQDEAWAFDGSSMDLIAAMGGTAVAGNFAWIDIEPVEGAVDWSAVDHQVEEAEARGLEVFAYTGLTPDWALPPEAGGTPGIGYRFPPDEQYVPQFEAHMTELAARYCGRVRYYEFWNEPNGCSWIQEGCANGDQAPSYAPWLMRWYEAMKAGCADTVLAVGGLDCNAGVGDGCAAYVEDLYAAGAGEHFDAVALHPYGDTSEAGALHWDAITGVYAVLQAHGDGDRSLWLNEWGWNTADEPTKAALVDHVLTELERPAYDMVFQAQYLILTDLPSTPDDGHDFGLCSRDLTTLEIAPRDSWYAFRDHEKVFEVTGDDDTGDDDAGDDDAGDDDAGDDDAGDDDAGGGGSGGCACHQAAGPGGGSAVLVALLVAVARRSVRRSSRSGHSRSTARRAG